MKSKQEKNYRQVPVSSIKYDHSLLFGRKGVLKNCDGGYSIRIVSRICQSSSTCNMGYDYFCTDKDGVVISSPRGLAKQYNKKVKFIGLDEEIEALDKIEEVTK